MKMERPVCPHCGSKEVVADGSLEFDAAAGEWRAGHSLSGLFYGGIVAYAYQY